MTSRKNLQNLLFRVRLMENTVRACETKDSWFFLLDDIQFIFKTVIIL